jgi:hypothetical protein
MSSRFCYQARELKVHQEAKLLLFSWIEYRSISCEVTKETYSLLTNILDNTQYEGYKSDIFIVYRGYNGQSNTLLCHSGVAEDFIRR